MKTIEEASKEYYNSREDNDYTIETDFAFKAGVEFAQKWISVEDELPKEDGAYLVDVGWGFVVRRFNTYHNVWDDEDGDDYFTDAIGGKITHWRPIEFK